MPPASPSPSPSTEQSPTSTTRSVSDVVAAVAQDLRQGIGARPIWITGTLSGLKKDRTPRGHRYFSLIEHSDDGQRILAKLNAVIWSSRIAPINQKASRAGVASDISNGSVVRMLGLLTFRKQSGSLQFEVSDIDTDALRAQRLLDREAAVEALQAEGAIGQNTALTVPAMPLRIAAVTSWGSAAHRDVERVFRQAGFPVKLLVSHTHVQGDEAPAEIVAALRSAVQVSPDVILVCRGGGDEVDLRAFDSLQVAREIAVTPVPVFVGIGHETDKPVADVVAHTAFATPTAAAEGVVSQLRACRSRVDLEAQRLAGAVSARHEAATSSHVAANHALHRAVHKCTRSLHERRALLASRLTAHMGATCARRRNDLRAAEAALSRALDASLDRARERTRNGHALLTALDPKSRLQRGWSITRGSDGRVITSHDQVAAGRLAHHARP